MKRVLSVLAISLGLLSVSVSPAWAYAEERGYKSCGSYPAPHVGIYSRSTYNVLYNEGMTAVFYRNWGTNTWRNYSYDTNHSWASWQVQTRGRLDYARTFAACIP
jgi:hypothetical protein